jgi:RNA-directed DNA polymerase
MMRRAQRAVGQRRVWLRELAHAARHAYPEAPRDRPRELATFLAACDPFLAAFDIAFERDEPAPRIQRWYVARTTMAPTRWPVAPLASVADLQDLVGLRLGDLLWLADARGLEGKVQDERLRHYRYSWLHKASGGLRLIEEPKPRLKLVQRVVLREVINHIPVHDAAHGFRRGRSAVTYAAAHAGRRLVIHLDLEDFFGTVPAGRIYGIFRTCGYPEPVAHLLTALATNAVPWRVWALRPDRPAGPLAGSDFRLGQHLRHPHLPQGAPTSPALANLVAFRLDGRLAGLAAAAGFAYGRYADDLAFSTDDACGRGRAERLVRAIEAVVVDEGFRINPFKTFFQRSGQRQLLAGVVVNDHPNVRRRDYDALKAILHNCAQHGPQGQNRHGHPNFEAHLRGRISRVGELHPSRGARLLELYGRIDWSAMAGDPAGFGSAAQSSPA